MKILTPIFSIFCLLISIYPRCSDEDCQRPNLTLMYENEQAPAHKDCGLCTPFMNCGACVGFVSQLDKEYISDIIYSQDLKEVFGFDFNSVETDYSERLWQPPKQVIIS
ncbi:hypothetical protein [Salegentibacter sp. F14]